jgi:uncharacterized membrane protein YhdT
LNPTIPTESFHAVTNTCVFHAAVTIIAELVAWLTFFQISPDDTVSTEGFPAVVQAVVFILLICIITFLISLIFRVFDVETNHAISTAGFCAIGSTSILIDTVPIIAFFAIVDSSVSAALKETNCIATVVSL